MSALARSQLSQVPSSKEATVTEQIRLAWRLLWARNPFFHSNFNADKSVTWHAGGTAPVHGQTATFLWSTSLHWPVIFQVFGRLRRKRSAREKLVFRQHIEAPDSRFSWPCAVGNVYAQARVVMLLKHWRKTREGRKHLIQMPLNQCNVVSALMDVILYIYSLP